MGEPADSTRSGRIAGAVVDETDVAMPDTSVTAQRVTQDRFRRQRQSWATRTDAEGRFALVLPEGTYDVRATIEGKVPAQAAGVTTGTDDLTLRFDTKGGMIAGQVTGRGVPIASFIVVVSRAIGRLEERAILTRSFIDPDGAFIVGPLAAGDYLVRVVASGHAPSRARKATVAIGGTERLNWSLSEGVRLVGRVVNDADGEAVAGAQVSLESNSVGGTLPIPVEAPATTDAQGQFTLSGIPPGLFSVQARAAGFHYRAASGLKGVDGQTVGPIEIRLTPLADPNERPKIELAGIGAVLAAEGDVLVVGRVLPKSGAEEAGIKAGDRIVRIDGQPVGDLDFNGVVQLIRGPVGTTVRLTIRRPSGAKETLVVPRRPIRQG